MFPLLIAKIRQSYDNKDDADFDAYIQNNIKDIKYSLHKFEVIEIEDELPPVFNFVICNKSNGKYL